MELTKEQEKYLIDRCDENSWGKIIVPTRLIKKYREFTNSAESNAIIRMRIQDIYWNRNSYMRG